MHKTTQNFSSLALKTLTACCFTLSLSGCVIHVGGDDWNDNGKGSVSSIFGEASVSSGKSVGDVSSVNGGVELHDDVSAERVDSVNGDVDIGNRVTVRSIDVVNGDIETGIDFTARGNLESVNGDIELAEKGKIEGSIVTVNGDIELRETFVGKNLRTTNGSLNVSNGSVIDGDIVYDRVNQRKWTRGNLPTLRIDDSSTVNGAIVLHRPVNLEIENAALKAKVQQRFSQE